MRLSPLAALAALVALATFPTFAAPAHAERADAPRRSAPAARLGAWLDGTRAQALLRPWSKCPQLVELLAEAEGETVRARTAGRHVDVERYSAGSGRWASAGATTLRLRRGSCEAAGFDEQGGKESLLSWISLRALDGAAASLETVAELRAALLVTEPDRAELAAARMLIELTRPAPTARASTPSTPAPTAADLFEPAWPMQAVHPGRPQPSAATVWSPAALRAAGLPESVLTVEDGAIAAAILVGAVRAPRALATQGRWQLWELRFRARLGGGLLAVYDRERDQHRWLLASERDTAVAKHFDVLSLCGDVALVRTSLEQEEELWVIDVARGLTRKLARRGSFRMAGKARLQIDPASGDGEREVLPLSSLGGC
jgi:hypothetical protein